ncbi:TPA: hypothetical protein U1079_002035, partial [Streptococcus suis]|nr:hypothetical protein [Streptococcus suis]
MFENLESIFNNQKNLMRQKLENNIYEITLSSSFKKIMEAHYSTDVNLKVGEFTSKFVNNRNQTVFFPNSWFYIAYLSVPFYREFNIYREFVSGWFKDNKKFESFCTNAKSGNMDYNVFNQQTVHLQASEKANVEKFLTDYNWWKGAKSIDRGDSVNSPLLQLYPLIASSSEFVAILTKGISDEISNLDPDRDFTFVDLKNDSSNYDPIISSSIYIKELVNETNHAGKLDEFVTELERKRERFLDKFSISDLKQLTTDELFGKKENNSLAYNLCDNPEYRCFGSAKQGNTTPVNWSKEDFIEFLEEVDSYIQQNTFDSIGDYSNFITFIESKGPYFERIWVQKYLFILYPEIFVSQFKENIQRDVLNAFSIIPEKT